MKITLKAARINSNYSLDKASKLLGISRVTLRNYETYKTVPNIKIINKMLKLYNVELDNISFISNKNCESEQINNHDIKI